MEKENNTNESIKENDILSEHVLSEEELQEVTGGELSSFAKMDIRGRLKGDMSETQDYIYKKYGSEGLQYYHKILQLDEKGTYMGWQK